MSDELELEIFQQALAELLTSGLSQDDIINRLKTDSKLAGYRAYIESFDPDMVSVASELMIKWARRKDEL